MRRLQFTLIVLSLLVLGAHFVRSGLTLLVGAVLVLAALCAVRQPWAGRAIQGALVLGVLEWLRTMIVLAHDRMRAGEPWGRMATILVVVVGVTALSAVLINSRTMRSWFRIRGGETAAPPAEGSERIAREDG